MMFSKGQRIRWASPLGHGEGEFCGAVNGVAIIRLNDRSMAMCGLRFVSAA